MLKQKYFLTGIFILSAERQPIKLSWRKIVWLQNEKQKTVSFNSDILVFAIISCVVKRPNKKLERNKLSEYTFNGVCSYGLFGSGWVLGRTFYILNKYEVTPFLCPNTPPLKLHSLWYKFSIFL